VAEERVRQVVNNFLTVLKNSDDAKARATPFVDDRVQFVALVNETVMSQFPDSPPLDVGDLDAFQTALSEPDDSTKPLIDSLHDLPKDKLDQSNLGPNFTH
jgi:hypothetical protein